MMSEATEPPRCVCSSASPPSNMAAASTHATPPSTIGAVGPLPRRLRRLPQQYFVALLAQVAEAAASEGPPLVDLGRGNPDIGPPPHVVEALAESARQPRVHGYGPIRGLARTKQAIARRYSDVYGVELDPEREVALVPGTKTAIVELALALADEGDTILLPDPYYPDYPSARALACRRCASTPTPAGRPTSTPHRPRPRSTSTTPRTPAPSARPTASSKPRCAGPGAPAAPSSTTRPTSTSSSTAASRAASSPRRARRTWASRCGRCRRRTGWPAGGSASSSATPRSSNGSTC